VRGTSPVPLAIAGLFLAAFTIAPARAEIRLEGSADAVRLEARDATVTEILEALHVRFELQFRGPTSSRRVTLTCEGPLRRVLTRVLDGSDYVIEPHADHVEVILVNTASPRDASPASFARRRAN
jgi:hypothetical protein